MTARRLTTCITTCILLVAFLWAPELRAQSTPATAFTYQGYLEEGGAPAAGTYDLRFTLYESETGGSQVGSVVTKDKVVVTDGVFAVALDFGDAFDTGALRYLEVAVRDGGSSGTTAYTTLSPREALYPAPTAIAAQTALALPNVTVDGDGKVGIGTESPSSPLTVDGVIESTSGGITFPDGTTQTTAGGGSANAWRLSGNSGTDPSTNFVGTTDDVPLELRVNGRQVLRLEPVTDRTGFPAPNVLGGWGSSTLNAGIYGATIGGGQNNAATSNMATVGGGNLNTASGESATVGGGQENTASNRSATVGGGEENAASGGRSTVSGGLRNTASEARSTVSGGLSNTASGINAAVGGGLSNAASGLNATVAGGAGNTASESSATVGGGINNTASDFYTTVGGGQENTASNRSATVGGGTLNIASGFMATVPGGSHNEALGRYSFAAGFYARVRADDSGTFVWSDNSETAFDRFVSTGDNQFLVRAAGGVGIGTNAPATQLHVQRDVSGAASTANHVAFIENTATSSGDVLALRTNASTPGAGENYITFKRDGSDIGAIQGNGTGGVELISGGGDFAEMLPRMHAGESIMPGEVVGVVGGRVTKATAGADRLMVVSDRALVVGNAPAAGEEGYEKVAFIGQVPVHVEGPVQVGDWIVASGRGDGTGRGVAPEAWDPERDGPIVGQAWDAQAGGTGRVNTAIGLGHTRPLLDRLARQRAEIDALRDEVQVLRDLIHAACGTARAARR